MNKILQNILCIVIAFSLISSLMFGLQVSAQQNVTGKLPGAWQRETADGQKYIITFGSDGSGMLGSAEGISIFRWTLQGNTLVMEGDGAKYTQAVMITAETLTITAENLPKPVVWNRLQNKADVTGRWKSSTKGDWQLNKDGTAVIDGQKYLYSVKDNTITLTAADGSLKILYTLIGDTLGMTLNGQIITLRRSLSLSP